MFHRYFDPIRAIELPAEFSSILLFPLSPACAFNFCFPANLAQTMGTISLFCGNDVRYPLSVKMNLELK